LDKIVAAVGVSAGIAAAILWFYASILPVPDNLDTFIAALQRISRVNAYAATASGVTALCVAYTFVRSFGPKPRAARG
jgi:hypothetical protein